jgi:uncharacterized protein (DUF2336 family)
MQAFVSLVNEVEGAISGGDHVKRVETLRRMTDLFVESAPGLQDSHVEVFDEVILRLSRDLEFRARVELSDRLADVENAPGRVVRDLAFDDNIEVARPIIERSTRLEEHDLLEIAQTQGQDHLLAMSRRPVLSEKITDVLVDRGDDRVVRTVASNEGAKFSDTGYTQLMTKAREDRTLQTILKTRGDISPRHMTQLVEIARAKVRETLKNEYGDKAAEIVEETIEDVAHKLARDSEKEPVLTDFSEAMAIIAARAKRENLVEDDVVKMIKEGKMSEALAAIAHLAGVPVDMVARAYHGTTYDPMLFLVRSIKFSWGTFKLLLTAKAGRLPPIDVLKNAFESFQQLSIATAQRVVRFTAAREKAQNVSAA